MYKKKHLIIGGNGFIGQNLIKKLIKKNIEISVFDSNVDNIVNVPNLKLFQKDIKDRASLDIAMKGIDIVYYFISTTNVITSVSNFEDNLLNLNYLKNCLDSMIANNVKKIVFASSGGTIYGEPNYLPIDEAHSTNPVSPYGIIKLAMEKYLLYYKKQFGVNPLILRYSNPFGAINKNRIVGAIDIFYNKISQQETIDIYGNPKNIIRDYIDIDDLINITIQLSFLNKANHLIYNVGSSLAISLQDIITYFEKLLNIKANLILKDVKNENVSKVILDTSRIHNELKLNKKENIDELLNNKYSLKNIMNKQ
jgi:UDP-glucose 4-epimerase